MNIKAMTMRNEAEYKARNLYIELAALAGDDTALLVNGLGFSMNIIKNDLLALLPPAPPAPTAPPVPEEVKEGE